MVLPIITRMRKQCVPGALSPPPPRLGTRLHSDHAAVHLDWSPSTPASKTVISYSKKTILCINDALPGRSVVGVVSVVGILVTWNRSTFAEGQMIMHWNLISDLKIFAVKLVLLFHNEKYYIDITTLQRRIFVARGNDQYSDTSHNRTLVHGD